MLREYLIVTKKDLAKICRDRRTREEHGDGYQRNGHVFLWLLGTIIAGLLLMLMMTGCKTTAAVSGTTATIATEKLSTWQDANHLETVHDTVYRDRWHNRWIQGDTVYIHDSVTIDRWRDCTIHDSIVRVDSIDRPVIVLVHDTTLVDKPLTGTQEFLQSSGIGMWCLLVLGLIVLLVKIFR